MFQILRMSYKYIYVYETFSFQRLHPQPESDVWNRSALPRSNSAIKGSDSKVEERFLERIGALIWREWTINEECNAIDDLTMLYPN
jgi:hypothetical protein